LARASIGDQPQALRFVDHIGREHELAVRITRRRDAIERLRLHHERTRLCLFSQNCIVERAGFRLCAFDGSDDDLVILAQMFPRQRPDIDTAAVFGEERCRFF
jgi:hypothetical protein